MACSHNLAKIKAKEAEIKSKENDISLLRININKCNEIKGKHEKFNEKMNCVINNLEGNIVVPGETYDKGKMTECLTKSKETIIDCDDIVKESNTKISLLETEIKNLKVEIDDLQGDCYKCIISKSNNSGKGGTATV